MHNRACDKRNNSLRKHVHVRDKWRRAQADLAHCTGFQAHDSVCPANAFVNRKQQARLLLPSELLHFTQAKLCLRSHSLDKHSLARDRRSSSLSKQKPLREEWRPARVGLSQCTIYAAHGCAVPRERLRAPQARLCLPSELLHFASYNQ